MLTPEVLYVVIDAAQRNANNVITVTGNAENFLSHIASVRVWDKSEADPPGGLSITMDDGEVYGLQISKE